MIMVFNRVFTAKQTGASFAEGRRRCIFGPKATSLEKTAPFTFVETLLSARAGRGCTICDAAAFCVRNTAVGLSGDST